MEPALEPKEKICLGDLNRSEILFEIKLPLGETEI